MRFYIYHWYRLTIVAFILLAFYLFFWQEELPTIEKLLIGSFMALLVHQFEEYVLPAGAPVVINKATFGEREEYRNYPGNMLSSMIVNHLAYVAYLMAIAFPQWIWLGLATMFFNLFQLIGHGLQMNYQLKTWYNAGLASVVFLFVPISIAYILHITENELAPAQIWLWGGLAFILLVVVTTILPVQLLKSRQSAFPIPQTQIDQCDKVQAFASLRKKK